jgi:hypothetical protein
MVMAGLLWRISIEATWEGDDGQVLFSDAGLMLVLIVSSPGFQSLVGI